MADIENFRVRVFFRKAGRLVLLSHLELARALERTIRRAGLPYALSQGFSPHMKIAFGAALPVGVGGEHECFDLQMTSFVAPHKVLEALRSVSIEDLMVSDCVALRPNDLAASLAYPLSVYSACLSGIPQAPFVVPETVTVLRKKKEKIVQVGDHLVDGPHLEGVELRFTLCAKTTGSLRSDVFVNALLEGQKESAVVLLSLTRVEQQAAPEILL